MFLIKDTIVNFAAAAVTLGCRHLGISIEDLHMGMREDLLTHPDKNVVEGYIHTVNLHLSAVFANMAETFIFDSEQIKAFLRGIDRQVAPADYPIPYHQMIFQFDKGIDEKLFTEGYHLTGAKPQAYDEILGLIVSFPEEGGKAINVIAWYKSTSVNRALVDISGSGDVAWDYHYGPHAQDVAAIMKRDKQRLVNLAFMCIAYMTSPRIEVERVRVDPKTNRRRVANGKRELHDYHVVKYKPSTAQDAKSNGSSGRSVSFRFGVIGHLRHYANGKIVVIPPHERGVKHEIYKPKVYKVE